MWISRKEDNAMTEKITFPRGWVPFVAGVFLVLSGPSCVTRPFPLAANPVAQVRFGDADYPMPCPSARHTEKVKAVRAGTYDLVLIGDSITHTLHNFGGKYQPLTAAVWDKYYAPRNAINLGHNGHRTEQILWLLQNGELDFKTSPKLFMIHIGTNNADAQHFSKMHTPEEIFAGTKAIVDTIRQRHPTSKILVLRIFPKGLHSQRNEATSPPVFSFSQEEVDTARRAGELTAQLADNKHVFWLDINHVFLRPDGTVNPGLLWDLLHPNVAGAEAWAKAVDPTISRLMGVEPIDKGSR
jgi:lysophospholipase L1-like esterase